MGWCSESWDLVAKSNNTPNLPDLLAPVIMHIKKYSTWSIYFPLLQVLHCKTAKAHIPQKEGKVLDFFLVLFPFLIFYLWPQREMQRRMSFEISDRSRPELKGFDPSQVRESKTLREAF